LLLLASIFELGGPSFLLAAPPAEAADLAWFSHVALMKRVAGSADWLESLCNDKLLQLNQSASSRHPDSATQDTTAHQDATVQIRISDATVIATHSQGLGYILHLNYDPASSYIL
jgi:hypothetical protein